ncbi:MAG: SOS response-associated peptidase family protein, partial [Lewinella sp.]|nr:SOS response-associated peptidase family protein [Lewinella sp.]
KGARGQPLKPKPVNNTRSDKLGSPFWSASFRERRCLVPVSAFAEAAGPKGGKTRTWFSLPDSPLLAVGGLWRDSAEWGAAYSMVMTDANAHVRPLHERMPVILPRHDWQQWLHGTPAEAFALCRPYAGEMQVDRTDEPWVARR